MVLAWLAVFSLYTFGLCGDFLRSCVCSPQGMCQNGKIPGGHTSLAKWPHNDWISPLVPQSTCAGGLKWPEWRKRPGNTKARVATASIHIGPQFISGLFLLCPRCTSDKSYIVLKQERTRPLRCNMITKSFYNFNVSPFLPI